MVEYWSPKPRRRVRFLPPLPEIRPPRGATEGVVNLNKMLTYIRDVRLEWFKIVWPSRDIVTRSTILIFVFSGIFAAFLFLVDGLMSALAGWIF